MDEVLYRTDKERPRQQKPGRVIVHAMQYFQPIQKTCRNLDHAKKVAAHWDYLPDQSIADEETYGVARSFAAVERITDTEGEDLMSPREVGELWLAL